MDAKLTLDRESFKALSAETRIRILKLLYSRRHMLAELAESLGMSLPAVKEHLGSLEKAALVLRKDEGRKWKYYELTQKGNAVLDPEQARIWIVLSLFVISVAGGIAALARTMLSSAYAPQFGAQKLAASLEAVPMAAEVLAIPAQKPFPLGIAVYSAWLLFLFASMLYFYLKRKKYEGLYLTKQKGFNK